MRSSVVWVLQVVDVGLLTYFVVVNSLYLLFSLVAYLELRRHRRKWTSRELGTVVRSPATPSISLIVPVHNVESTIRERLTSFLHLNFPRFEVVLVNDGSTDRTLDVSIKALDLMRAPVRLQQQLDTQPVRGVYRSLTNQDVVVIDKEHGGRADAINAGINAARYPLVCVIDADSRFEDDALARAVLPFVENPTTIAAGGVRRIANGCQMERGRVTRVGLPRSPLAVLQAVEYLRAFWAARVAQSVFGGLLTMSGAFDIYRRNLVIEAGGFRSDTAGEDTEIVTRLHRICLDRGEPYRIVVQPEAVCWSEAPETIRVLARQRNRWQRGILGALGAHAPLMFKPRYGVIGLLAVPYHLLFEAVGPVVEILAYGLTAVAVVVGLLDWRFAQMLFLAAVVYGALISLTTVLLEELSSRQNPRATDLLRLAAYCVLENLGYRQLTTWWRVTGVVDFVRARHHVGGGSEASPRPSSEIRASVAANPY